MNTAEAEEFDTVEGEIKALNKDVERLTRLEAIQKATAAPAKPSPAAEDPAKGTPHNPDNLQLRTVEKLEPGIAFARYAMCLTAAKGNHAMAATLAERHYPKTESIVKTLKAQAEGANLG
jgi:hypothetical protein